MIANDTQFDYSGGFSGSSYPMKIVSDIAIFVLKRDVKLQLTNYPMKT